MNNQMLSKNTQLLMGGPHINWKFHEHLADELES